MKPRDMRRNSFEEVLREHGVKPTANRLLVARALDDSRRPLSLAELEERLETLDRSSIFRVLTLFRDQHLVHVIEGGREGALYELCQSHDHAMDDDRHAHFYCESCHRTFCLEDIPVPSVVLPEGYEATSASYLIKGICPNCARAARPYAYDCGCLA